MRNTIEITTANIEMEVLNSDCPVLVEFGADWCPPCRMLEPVMDELAAHYAGQLCVGTVDVDAHPELQERYSIMGLPTLILFAKGKAIHTMLGYQTRQRIEAHIKPHLTGLPQP